MSTALTSICLRLCPGGNDGERVATVTSEVTRHTGSCVEWNRDRLYPAGPCHIPSRQRQRHMTGITEIA